MKNRKGWSACLVLLILGGAVLVWSQCRTPQTGSYQYDEGLIFNTIYHFSYQAKENYQSQIEEELQRFDASLSPFNPTSIISRFNDNDTTVEADSWFTTVFDRSMEIWLDTEGAFDPTVSPLVNLWGFGFKSGIAVTPEAVDSLHGLVGMERLALSDGRLYKDDSRMTLDFSAIAKGYAVDVVASFLQEKGVENYLVEIGGEIRAHGHNSQGKSWRIGIDTPDESNVAGGEIEAVMLLDDAALATSGNYRNYRIVNGQRVAHTIDPVSGYPIQHTLLSATVLAPDCMTADAYATAFMVLGVEKSLEIVARHPELETFLIYAVDSVQTAVTYSPGMKQYLFGD
ncbi:MAG: FAD:protein FMN transferase [Porphyromonadaceae bacterium]|nr:FAD:protein FMN transferase [Porphyromonadaceae bacterium]